MTKSLPLLQIGQLVGQSLFGRQFYQDERPDWIFVNEFRLGINYVIDNGESNDIGGLLDSLVGMHNVAVVTYDWNTNRYFVGSSFDLGDGSDSVEYHWYTTFVIKSKAVYAGQKSINRRVASRV